MKLPKPRYYFRLIQAFWQKHRRIIVLTFAITLISIYFFPKLIGISFFRRQQKIGLVGRYNLSNLPYEITSLISYGLTIPLPDGSIEPGLAQSWEIRENGKIYIFAIKDDVYWHDGSKVVAQDINYNFSDVNVTVVDDKHIRFELKEPFSPFPVVVSRPVFKKNLVGLGDYRAKSIERSGQYIRKLILVPTGKQNKPNLFFHFYPNEEAVKTGYKLGEVDFLEDIFSPDELKNWPNTKIEKTVKYDRYTAIFFNTQTEKLADKPIRQALTYAINKRWEPRALNSYNPDSWAFNSAVKPYEFDLENAKNLIGQNESESSVEKISLSTIPSMLSIAEQIKSDWQQLGIETEIHLIHSPSEEFEALLVSQQIPRDPDQYVLWHSTQETNLSKYKSPKLDTLLEDGRKTLNQDERKKIYQDFQRFLVEDSPAVFLFHPTTYTIERK